MTAQEAAADRVRAGRSVGRLCYVSTSVIPSATANSIHVMRMANAFAQCGWQVTLLARSNGQPVILDEIHRYYGTSPAFAIEHLRWPRMPLFGSTWFTRQSGRWLRDNVANLDAVYGRHAPTLRFAARIGLRSTLEVHAPPRTRVHRLMVGQFTRAPGFRRIVAISQALRAHYLSLFPELTASQIIVAHDGADDTFGRPTGIEPIAGTRAGFRVGYVGQLYRGKGMELIEAIAPRLPDVHFHIIGGNASDVRNWRSRIAGENAYFHGFHSPAEIGRWISAFDIVVAPYQRRVEVAGGGGDIAQWMSPLKIFEYMSAGKPMVVSDLPVIREVLLDSVNALLVPPDDPARWVAAIVALRDDPALRRRLGDTARRDFLAQYTWRARAERVLA